MSTPDIIFECKKCSHNLYIRFDTREELEQKLNAYEECDNCGGDVQDRLVFVGFGNYQEIYGGI